jgi:hypothetical protein
VHDNPLRPTPRPLPELRLVLLPATAAVPPQSIFGKVCLLVV